MNWKKTTTLNQIPAWNLFFCVVETKKKTFESLFFPIKKKIMGHLSATATNCKTCSGSGRNIEQLKQNKTNRKTTRP